MNISVELTFTPIKEYYEAIIMNFQSLGETGLKTIKNIRSTQFYGAYGHVMRLLQKRR